MAFDFAPQPHEEAIALIRGKPVVTRQVFDQLLPELRGRAFTVTGIEAANTLQRLRDAIAELPAGKTWNEVKEEMLPDISPYFSEEPEEAERRAELLIRTHGFQAFQAANWRTAQEDEDTTHLQYLATEDTHVRESHLALNGLIVPKDDPFWQKHTPPWDWGCRCRIRPMNPDLVDVERAADEKRSPDNKLVMEGAALRKLREGTLIRDGQVFDVTAPSESNKENAYEWHPGNLTISLEELRGRYDEESWGAFESFAKKERMQTAAGEDVTVWEWLRRGDEAQQRLSEKERDRFVARPGLERPAGLEQEPLEPPAEFVNKEEIFIVGDHYEGPVVDRRAGTGNMEMTLWRRAQREDIRFELTDWAVDPDDTRDYARRGAFDVPGERVMHELTLKINRGEIADETQIAEAAKSVGIDTYDNDTVNWLRSHEKKAVLVRKLKERGFTAVRFSDVSPLDQYEHETILLLREPK